MGRLAAPLSGKDPPHVVLNLSNVNAMDNHSAKKICQIQQSFYEKNCSFVICGLPAVEKMLDEHGWLEVMNVTPTESEAWDIVQMEEIERNWWKDEESNT